MELKGLNVVVQKPRKNYDTGILQCKSVFSSQPLPSFSARLQRMQTSQK
jgi:hypothetical protein